KSNASSGFNPKYFGALSYWMDGATIKNCVVYAGGASVLSRAIEPLAEVLEQGEVADTSYNSMRIRINDGVSVRDCIARANEAVELRSFKEIIPSMNDIFIRAVEGKL
ncbi:MAG: DUF4162 domain-containing protein, partial [Alistipes sp.]|nr:DUF4162 domain-containing protein [Alistipes sp.]